MTLDIRVGLPCALAPILAAATPAQAITFATGQGTDSAGCGAVTAPCRTLRQAVTNTPSGGYVALRGPANFGWATLDKSLSIVGESGATLSGAGARTIDPEVAGVVQIIAGASDRIRLRGLEILDAPVPGAGVLWIAGKAVEIADCVIPAGVQAMTRDGGAFTVIDSDVSAIWAGSSTDGVKSYFDRLRANPGIRMGWGAARNPWTVIVNSSVTGSWRTVTQPLSDKAAAGAGSASGVTDSVENFGGELVLRNSVVSTGGTALHATGESTIHLSRSTVTGNARAFEGSDGLGVLFTYGDNVIRGNTNDTLAPHLSRPLR